jgi:hypothetical protein
MHTKIKTHDAVHLTIDVVINYYRLLGLLILNTFAHNPISILYFIIHLFWNRHIIANILCEEYF